MTQAELYTLDQVFNGLRSRNPQRRLLSARNLKEHLLSVSREVTPSEQVKRYNSDVYKRISDLIESKNNWEKLGGVEAINALLDLNADGNDDLVASSNSNTEDRKIKRTVLKTYLDKLIPSSDLEVMYSATRTLGKLAIPGSALAGPLVEFYMPRAIEWLNPDNKQEYRHAAVLIITSLSYNLSTSIYNYVHKILENIWIALRDSKLIIREDAAIAMRYCLSIVYERDSQMAQFWFSALYTEASQCFKATPTSSTTISSTAVEVIHGSLLCYRELVIKGTSLLSDKIDELYDNLNKLKDHKNVIIRREFSSIIPKLAHFNRANFVEKHLHRVLLYYFTQLKIPRDRDFIFVAIGDIATEVKNRIVDYLEGILTNIDEALAIRSVKARREIEPACFYCLEKLALALGSCMTKYINNYHTLNRIFKCSINDNMIQTLQVLIEKLPALEPAINERLIKIVTLCLSGYEYKHPGSQGYKRQMNTSLAQEYRQQMLQRDGGTLIYEKAYTGYSTESGYEQNLRDLDEDPDVTVIIQALKVLSCFHFADYNLTDFTRFSVMTYVDHDNIEVRKRAALTTCALFMKDSICYQTSESSLKAVNEVLGKLLVICITDPVAEIRLEVLKVLGENFDPQLSQADNAKLLFVATNDGNFEIRKAAIKIIGRLSAINPAYIVPSLRKLLMQLLTTLEYDGSSKRREETAAILSTLISHSKDVTKPYVKQILDVLIPKAKDQSSGASINAIQAIGELAVVSGEDMKPFIHEMMPIFLDTFQDQSAGYKRDTALRALGQLASSSGYVIDPLLDYPQLLGMLVSILKSESSQMVRRETVRLLGVLGALDPYKHREVDWKIKSSLPMEQITEQNAPPIDVSLLMQGMSPSNEEFYPTVVITTLMKILKDSSLVNHHTAVAQAVIYIYQTLNTKCIPFLNHVIPGFIHVMMNYPDVRLEFYFNQLGKLINIVKQHVRPYLKDIFVLIKKYFATPNLTVTILGLIQIISSAMDGEFKLYLTEILPLMLEVLETDTSPEREASLAVLNTFVVLGSNIDLYVHLVIPQIVSLFDFSPYRLRKASIETIGKLASTVHLNDLSSRIIHPLLRALETNSSDELKKTIMNTISIMLLQMRENFLVFIPLINKILVQHKWKFPVYEQLMEKLLNGQKLPQNLIIGPEHESLRTEAMEIEPSSNKLTLNQQALRQSWDASQCRTKVDWVEWIMRLSLELLRESPSHALRACSTLASDYTPLAKDLFNASFASCWNELSPQNKNDLIQAFGIALSAVQNPPEIHQQLLNVVEFMERDDKPLPIRVPTLGQYAKRCHAYAKALHYKELEFIQEPSTPTIESLISINNQLQQSDAAIGILKQAQQHHDLQLKETWYEKLQRWDDALNAYNEREKEDPDSMDITMGKMRSLHALGEWEQLSELAQDKWLNSSTEIRRAIAPLAAAASWGLGQWDRMDTYIGIMKHESPDKAFFNAVLCLHRNNFEGASTQILRARDLLITEMTALVSESYNRAYSVVVRVQMLAELEEIIRYKCYPQGSEKRAMMRQTWTKRLLGCQRNVDIWQRMLKVRALVVKPKQDMEMWIKFANLCRKSGRLGLAEKSLNSLLDEGDSDNPRPSRAPPQVVYAQLKYMWASGQQRAALSHLIDFTSKLSRDLGLNENEAITQPLPTEVPGAAKHVEEYTKLLARCYLKQGEWKVTLNPNWRNEEATGSILGSYLLATHFDSNWYKAWHNWALANFQVISAHQSTHDGIADVSSSARSSHTPDEVKPDMLQHYVIPAIKGFFHSISLSELNPLQDTLRLLTLWFSFGGITEAAHAMLEGFSMVKIDTWLQVIPQLISRIHQPNEVMSRSLLNLLTDLGKAHPQALVYPLAVAVKSNSELRKQAALTIIEKMRIHSPTLVEQSELVSEELIRVAVLWYELWYEGLEDASRLFFGEHNTEKMFLVLEPLHKLLDKGPETLREISFQNAFGRELNDAFNWVLNYRNTKDIANLNQAWDIYYNVFRRINRQLPQLKTLELQYVSPKLLAAHDLELAVPGTYSAGQPIICIQSFDSTFSVINSKQRPRKMNIRGSDGKGYQYVLKGHEDIRQDSLVMQLFGLVNTLLVNDAECFKRHLDIQQYPAIPLSPSSGLLGWVPNSDTFHVLIRDYREPRKILLNIEHRIMLQMAPDYENLTLLQKVEVFTYALDNTRGQDLYKVLWLKSRSSEAWLDRRTTYTRSLAVMSMVGYILGLGDRHPSNLMMDRITGKVIHIDFGDCFEAAILREKFPEKVPFRLTRMISYAMEVSGIEGSFRITCENVMRVLRENKESLMAILEAFAYDPLINWGFDFPIDELAESSGLKLNAISPSELLVRGEVSEKQASEIESEYNQQMRNARAAFVLKRITDKLTGNDFKRAHELDVTNQVDKLIQQATSVENLCQHYIGWCSFW
ncbi:hypothetical protein LJB42_004483 [Komagataella kurtzmanii]|nr:hypothetical protein LJB42_004483 [Komagataella kurtzmanii]